MGSNITSRNGQHAPRFWHRKRVWCPRPAPALKPLSTPANAPLAHHAGGVVAGRQQHQAARLLH